MVRSLANDQLILALRDSVLVVEPLTDDELRERYVEEAPGSLIRARHIFLAWPENATSAQRDSVIREMEDLRWRIIEGEEDFATLARQVSQDTGTAVDGGEVPVFGRGQMLPPVEEAAFALDPGEVSDAVVSQHGLHLLRGNVSVELDREVKVGRGHPGQGQARRSLLMQLLLKLGDPSHRGHAQVDGGEDSHVQHWRVSGLSDLVEMYGPQGKPSKTDNMFRNIGGQAGFSLA